MIAVIKFKLYLPMASSLKDKRRIIKSLKEKGRNKFNIAVAEIDNHELWKNSTIGVVTISKDKSYIDKLVEKIINYFEDFNGLEVINYTVDYY